MGMRDEMEKFEKAEHGQIVVSFDRTKKEAVDMTIEVNGASNKEIGSMIIHFIIHLAEDSDTHVTTVIKALVMEMMAEDIGGKKDDDSV